MVQAFVEMETQLVKQRPSGGTESCEGPECLEAISRNRVMSHLTDELARHAAQSSHPRLYALAFDMCRLRTQPPACSSLSRQWSRIDPENGAPWLFAAKADASGKPRATIDEVLFRLAGAQRVDGQFFSVAGEIVRHAGIDDSWVLAASLAAIEAIGVSAGRFMEPLQYLTQACRVMPTDVNFAKTQPRR